MYLGVHAEIFRAGHWDKAVNLLYERVEGSLIDLFAFGTAIMDGEFCEPAEDLMLLLLREVTLV